MLTASIAKMTASLMPRRPADVDKGSSGTSNTDGLLPLRDGEVGASPAVSGGGAWRGGRLPGVVPPAPLQLPRAAAITGLLDDAFTLEDAHSSGFGGGGGNGGGGGSGGDSGSGLLRVVAGAFGGLSADFDREPEPDALDGVSDGGSGGADDVWMAGAFSPLHAGAAGGGWPSAAQQQQQQQLGLSLMDGLDSLLVDPTTGSNMLDLL